MSTKSDQLQYSLFPADMESALRATMTGHQLAVTSHAFGIVAYRPASDRDWHEALAVPLGDAAVGANEVRLTLETGYPSRLVSRESILADRAARKFAVSVDWLVDGEMDGYVDAVYDYDDPTRVALEFYEFGTLEARALLFQRGLCDRFAAILASNQDAVVAIDATGSSSLGHWREFFLKQQSVPPLSTTLVVVPTVWRLENAPALQPLGSNAHWQMFSNSVLPQRLRA